MNKSESSFEMNKNHSDNRPLILIVDDTLKNLQVSGNLLKRENYQISVATGGNQALKMLEEITPDLILLDIMMPDINGFEVCKKIKESPATKEIPVIFLTAKNEPEDIVEGFKTGAVDYVAKPFISTELIARVRTHVELKTARDTQKQLVADLKKALDEVKQLTGLIPICCACKKIRDDTGYWNQLEAYISMHTDADFTHSICPDCKTKLYPELFGDK